MNDLGISNMQDLSNKLCLMSERLEEVVHRLDDFEDLLRQSPYIAVEKSLEACSADRNCAELGHAEHKFYNAEAGP